MLDSAFFDPETAEAAAALLARARAHGLKIATAESCTGGLIIGALTEIAGSSDVVDRGFITYSNEAKMQMLGITSEALTKHGAVSEVVAKAMAMGALAASDANLSVAVTGIAGPGGGSDEKPVGLVHFASALNLNGFDTLIHYEGRFGDIGRTHVRFETLHTALGLMNTALDRFEEQ